MPGTILFNVRRRYRRWFTASLWLTLSASQIYAQPADAPAKETDEMAMESLVSVDWLAAHLDDPDLVVIDCTVVMRQTDGELEISSGRPAYEGGHIPRAAFGDLTGALSDGDSPVRYRLPSADEFARAMGSLGVGDDSRVVLYDRGGSMWAARVWWMLRWIGFDNAAILDGGLPAWEAAGHPLSTERSDYRARSLTVNERADVFADQDEVRAAISDDDVGLVDALPAEHYAGTQSLYARPGHIATAGNVPVYSVLDDSGRFKPKAELAGLFDPASRARTIHYCGGGIAASGTAFAMRLAGYDDVAVYINSLQEWTADPENPMETGDGSD